MSVRGGRIQCTKTYFFKDSFDNNLDNLLQRVCFTHYQQKSQIAPKILVNINLKEKAVLEEGLSKKFDQPVKLVTSKNKNNMRFQALANLNAAQAIINKLGEADKFKEHFKALGSIFNAVNQKHTLEYSGTNFGRFGNFSFLVKFWLITDRNTRKLTKVS